MTLNNILEALAINKTLFIKIVTIEEEKEVEVISFEAPGYESLSSELLAKTVTEIRMGTEMTFEKKMTILVE